MKGKDKIVLSAVFIAAVAAGQAKAQEVTPVKLDEGKNEQYDTTTTRRHHRHTGHGPFHLFGRHKAQQNNNPTPPGGQTSAPRTHGFGNTLRTTGSAHS